MVGVAQHVEECLEEELPGLFTLRLLTYPLTGKIQQVLVSTKSGFRSSGTKIECQFVEEDKLGCCAQYLSTCTVRLSLKNKDWRCFDSYQEWQMNSL